MGKKEKHSVEFKAVMPVDQLKAYLTDLIDSLDKGCICVQNGPESVALKAGDTVKVEIEAKEKKDKSKFSLEISWKNDMEAKGDPTALKIGSVATVPPQDYPAAMDETENTVEPAEEDNESENDEMEELRHGE